MRDGGRQRERLSRQLRLTNEIDDWQASSRPTISVESRAVSEKAITTPVQAPNVSKEIVVTEATMSEREGISSCMTSSAPAE